MSKGAELREIRKRDARYDIELPEGWIAQRDRRFLLEHIDRLYLRLSNGGDHVDLHLPDAEAEHVDVRPVGDISIGECRFV